LYFAVGRSDMEASSPRFALISRRAQFITVSPEIFYE
jgi:hypothetical protein